MLEPKMSLQSSFRQLVETVQATSIDDLEQALKTGLSLKSSGIEHLQTLQSVSIEIEQSFSELRNEIQTIFEEGAQIDSHSMGVIVNGLKDNLNERCVVTKAAAILKMNTNSESAFVLMMENLTSAVTVHTDMLLKFYANIDDCMDFYLNFMLYYKHFNLQLEGYEALLLRRWQSSIRTNDNGAILITYTRLFNLAKALSQLAILNHMLFEQDVAEMIFGRVSLLKTKVIAQSKHLVGYRDELEQLSALIASNEALLPELARDLDTKDALLWHGFSVLTLKLLKKMKADNVTLTAQDSNRGGLYQIFTFYKKRLEAVQPIPIQELVILGENIIQRQLDDKQRVRPEIVMHCMTAYTAKLAEVVADRSNFTAWFAYTGLLGIYKLLKSPNSVHETESAQKSKAYELIQQYLDLEKKTEKRKQAEIAKIQEIYAETINGERKKHLKKMEELKRVYALRFERICKSHGDSQRLQYIQFEEELRNLNERNAKALSAFNQSQLEETKLAKFQSAQRIKDAELAHEQVIQAQAMLYQQRIAAIELCEKEAMTRITGLPAPVAQIKIPATIQTILNILEDANIEYFLLGGYLRNQLFCSLENKPQTNKHSDIDVIVNLKAELLPTAILKSAHRDTNLPKLLRIGQIDFWCHPWNSIQEVLETKDFPMNTLAAKADGQVYDFLGVGLAALKSPEIQVLGEAKRYREDPTLALRGIRFCIHMGKMFSNRDWTYIISNLDLIKNMEISAYLRNLERIFIDQNIVNHFWYAMNTGVLPILFPFAPQTNVAKALSADKCLSDYLTIKLNQLAQFPNQYRTQAFLALTLLVIHFVENKSDFLVLNRACINRFFNWIGKDVKEKEYGELLSMLEGMLFGSTSYMGLFKEYCAYAEQNTAYYESAQPMLTPAYDLYTTTQPMSSQPMPKKTDSRHSMALP